MIRRAAPLGADPPRRWLLIPQQEHARLSHAIAAAWGNGTVPPVVCPADEPDHPLAGVRRELLAAILKHDDGWAAWWGSPGIDPEHGRPYSFTEMPPADAQRLWRASITVCREEGPLAGWVVASHFSALQGKRDADYHEWVDWLAEVDAEREPWLDEWLAASPLHTRALAERCLAWLQAMDWISLWLCCVCPDRPYAAGADPLVVAGEATGGREIRFKPTGRSVSNDFDLGNHDVVVADPWPFECGEVCCRVRACEIDAVFHHGETLATKDADRHSLGWALQPVG